MYKYPEHIANNGLSPDFCSAEVDFNDESYYRADGCGAGEIKQQFVLCPCPAHGDFLDKLTDIMAVCVSARRFLVARRSGTSHEVWVR